MQMSTETVCTFWKKKKSLSETAFKLLLSQHTKLKIPEQFRKSISVLEKKHNTEIQYLFKSKAVA